MLDLKDLNGKKIKCTNLPEKTNCVTSLFNLNDVYKVKTKQIVFENEDITEIILEIIDKPSESIRMFSKTFEELNKELNFQLV
jgi:hypothetical protein